MNLVIKKLKEEKKETIANIFHCEYAIKSTYDTTISGMYRKELRKYEKYLSQLDIAINILKAENKI